MNAPILPSCPFCGSTMQTKAGSECWYTHCTSCQAEGPIRDTEAEAIAASNRRAGAAAPPDLPSAETTDECPKCGLEEWDEMYEPGYPPPIGRRCARCDHEWNPQTQEPSNG